MSKSLELFEYSSPLGIWTGLLFNKKLAYFSKDDLKKTTRFAKSQGYTLQHSEVPSLLKNELDLYFSAKLQNFNYPLHFLESSAFEKKVWDCLRKIPYGETRSYAWVAQEIKQAKAYRAVGNANGKNRIPIVIPCHRVINSDGNLGGYSSGLELKKKLLKIEGIEIHGTSHPRN